MPLHTFRNTNREVNEYCHTKQLFSWLNDIET
jgi:hypothetical protein